MVPHKNDSYLSWAINFTSPMILDADLYSFNHNCKINQVKSVVECRRDIVYI